jgi:hypothetical protein
LNVPAVTATLTNNTDTTRDGRDIERRLLRESPSIGWRLAFLQRIKSQPHQPGSGFEIEGRKKRLENKTNR